MAVPLCAEHKKLPTSEVSLNVHTGRKEVRSRVRLALKGCAQMYTANTSHIFDGLCVIPCQKLNTLRAQLRARATLLVAPIAIGIAAAVATNIPVGTPCLPYLIPDTSVVQQDRNRRQAQKHNKYGEEDSTSTESRFD